MTKAIRVKCVCLLTPWFIGLAGCSGSSSGDDDPTQSIGDGDGDGDGGGDGDGDGDGSGDGDGDGDGDGTGDGDGDGDGGPKWDLNVPDGGQEPLEGCAGAQQVQSNLGCEFWAVDMENLPPRDTYTYAVSISNPSHTEAVTVDIYDRNDNDAEQLIITDTVEPREVKVLNISGAHGAFTSYYAGQDAGFIGNGIGLGRAFRIETDLPVIAIQFNPIGGATGFTTDASLLLPTHTLGKDYTHLAWGLGYGSGSTLEIVATEDDTTIGVTPTAAIAAGINGLPSMGAGVETEFTMDRYDHAQLTADDVDLSGSIITSDKPIAVFGGHSCANVPSEATTACDHVEEQIFPLQTWGTKYVASRNPQRSTEPMRWKVVAAEDGTTVQFDPAVSIGANVQLDAGETAEFDEQLDFHVDADKPILVAGYMHGCSAVNLPNCPGDPYMVLMVPIDQYLDDYVFIVDDSYDADFLKIVRTAGSPVQLECMADPVPADRWTQVGSTNYEWATIDMNPGEELCAPGTNEATGASGFGIIVSGQASAASYAYPGGLALDAINPQG